MAAEIGLLAVVYVLFRGVESIAACGPGGCHADLAWTSRAGILLCAMGAMVMAIVVAHDLLWGL